MMPLIFSIFKKEIDPKIVDRGKKIYQSGNLSDFEESDENVFTALATGTEVYEVSVTLDKDYISKHSCSCQYNWGEFCKHEVALLCTVEEYLSRKSDGTWDGEIVKNQSKKTASKKITSKPRKKRKTIADKVEEVLENLTLEEALSFIREETDINRPFREKLLRKIPIVFDISDFEKAKKQYIAQIKNSIRGAEKNGFIGYWEAQYAVEGAWELLILAEKKHEEKDFWLVFCIIQAEIETLYPALERVDDSNGEFGSAIEEAKVLFMKLSETTLPVDLRPEFFQYCLSQTISDNYEGWSTWTDFFDWALNVLDIKNDIEVRLFEKNLEDYKAQTSKQKDSWFEKYEIQEWIKLKLKFLYKVNRTKEATRVTEKYLYILEVRQQKIDYLKNKKDYKTIEILLKEGVKIAKEKSHPGVVKAWESQLDEVWGILGKISERVNLWKRHFLDDFDWQAFEQLKTHYKNDAISWKQFIEKSEQHFSSSERHTIEFYYKVGKYQTLFETIESLHTRPVKPNQWGMINKFDVLPYLERYEPELRKVNTIRLVEIFLDCLESSLTNTGRTVYQDVVRKLIRLQTYGDREKIQSFIDKMLARYKNRPAMIEEFMKI